MSETIGICIYPAGELAGVDLTSEMGGTMRATDHQRDNSQTPTKLNINRLDCQCMREREREGDVCESLLSPRLFCSIVWSDWAVDNRQVCKTKALHERREGKGSHRLLWSALVSPLLPSPPLTIYCLPMAWPPFIQTTLSWWRIVPLTCDSLLCPSTVHSMRTMVSGDIS